LAGAGKLGSGNRLRALMELGQRMGSREFAAARGRAYQDYFTKVGAEQAQYGRGIDAYGRGVGREAELQSRGRQRYLDISQRSFRDYLGESTREQTQYERDVGGYGRAYGREQDYLNRLASLAKIGQTATSDVGRLGSLASSGIAQGLGKAGEYQSAGTVGQYGAWSGAIGDIGRGLAAKKIPGQGETYQRGRGPLIGYGR